MKTVYFVRHGESQNNAADRYNSPETALSERGKQQVAQIAKRCSKLPIEFIVSSPMKRAHDTALAIGEHTHKKVELSELFGERQLPSRIQGGVRTAFDVKGAIHTIFENFAEPSYRYEDAENFEDLKTRALNALTYLEERPEKHIAAVSHGFFMWMLAAAAIFGPSLSGEVCKGIIRGLGVLENTGLSVFTYKDNYRSGNPASPWEVRVWNDHAHLG